MMDENQVHQTLTLELTRGKFTPSSTPHHPITFHLKFDLKVSEFFVSNGSEILTHTTHQTTTDRSTRLFFKKRPDRTTPEVAHLFAHDTFEAITSILEHLPFRVFDEERLTLIDFAIEEGQCALTNNMYDDYEAVDLYILVRMEDRIVFDLFDESNEYCCMVPANDASVELLLKKCDGERIGFDERCCCICYEEFDSTGKRGFDGDLLKMPCEHVFHGECIKTWLRTSHYCPLCRFQMPTEILDA